jgi:hypothetical protein
MNTADTKNLVTTTSPTGSNPQGTFGIKHTTSPGTTTSTRPSSRCRTEQRPSRTAINSNQSNATGFNGARTTWV